MTSQLTRSTWRLDRTLPDDPPDLPGFVDVLNRRSDFFSPGQPLAIARAPGRLDLMGGIADYSGSLVLQLPLAAATFVAAQPDPEPVLTVFSTAAEANGDEPLVRVPLVSLLPQGGGQAPALQGAATAFRSMVETNHYDAIRQALTARPRERWVSYVAGTLAVLHGEKGLTPQHGVRLFVHSSVPLGKGVSSSAALEVAAMQALCAIYDVTLTGHEMALLCQKAENLVAGAPCGVMDQMTAACGQQDRLLSLVCQPAELQAPAQLPEEIEVWGIDSGIKHAVSGSDYTSVRVGAFMGYRIIVELAALPVHAPGGAPHHTRAPASSIPPNGGVPDLGGQREDDSAPDRATAPHQPVTVEDHRWGGYLANVTPSEWTAQFEPHLPESMDGATFLARYGGTTDPVTHVLPERIYAVRAPSAHPIFEHHRVRLFRALLDATPLGEEHLRLLGELMYQSHASYSACGLGSDGTDRLVQMVREAGPASGLYGAKITGGGCGGTVAILARRGSHAAVEAIRARYQQETGRPALLIGGSSAGATQFGTRRLMPETT